MSTNKPMTQEQLDAIRERAAKATAGPWAAWEDQDGQPHMQGRLMVGVAAGVIPDGDTWIEGPDVNNPVAETYIPEDRVLIAHAPQDLTDLLAEVERLRALLTVDDAMVERAAGTLFKQDFLERNPWADGARAQRSLEQARASTPRAWGQYLQVVRAALNAALGTGEDA